MLNSIVYSKVGLSQSQGYLRSDKAIQTGFIRCLDCRSLEVKQHKQGLERCENVIIQGLAYSWQQCPLWWK